MSRAAPWTIVPATQRARAARDRLPPQPAQSRRPWWSTTIRSPGRAASIAAVHRCRADGVGVGGPRRTVTARPEMRWRPERLPSPEITCPSRPSRSQASDAAQASTWARRSSRPSGWVTATPEGEGMCTSWEVVDVEGGFAGAQAGDHVGFVFFALDAESDDFGGSVCGEGDDAVDVADDQVAGRDVDVADADREVGVR